MPTPPLFPDWRYRRALALIDDLDGPLPPGRRDDVHVREVRQFLLDFRRAAGHPKQVHALAIDRPGQFLAHQLYRRDDARARRLALVMEARLLAGQDDGEIAQTLGTSVDILRYYRAWFFDVRGRLGDHDWIMNRVIIPAMIAAMQAPTARAGTPAPRDSSFASMFVGYFGGAAALDCVLDGIGINAHDGGKPETLRQAWQRHYQVATMWDAVSKLPGSVSRERMTILLDCANRLIVAMKVSGSAEDPYVDLMRECLESVTWKFGSDVLDFPDNELVAAFDRSAVEPRDDELWLMAAGIKPENYDELLKLTLPPPRPPPEEGRPD